MYYSMALTFGDLLLKLGDLQESQFDGNNTVIGEKSNGGIYTVSNVINIY